MLSERLVIFISNCLKFVSHFIQINLAPCYKMQIVFQKAAPFLMKPYYGTDIQTVFFKKLMNGAILTCPSKKTRHDQTQPIPPSTLLCAVGVREEDIFQLHSLLQPFSQRLRVRWEASDTAICHYKISRWNQKEKAGGSSLMAIGYFNQTLAYRNIETAKLYRAVFRHIKTGSKMIKKF